MDGITSEERQLIDEAVNAGRVTKVPRGRFAFSDTVEYRDGQLRYKEPDKASVSWGRGKKPDPKVTARRDRMRKLHAGGMSTPDIAKTLGLTAAYAHAEMQRLGLKSNRAAPAGETVTEKKARRAKMKVAEVKDRRRFKAGVPASGKIYRIAAVDATGTQYPNTVMDPDGSVRTLKDGRWNGKIGGAVLTGWLKGAAIYTLTLEERATCPRSCAMWRGCYGNQMDKAHRFRHGAALIDRLRVEVAEACATHERVLIRLHVLGDFWSEEYVGFWAGALRAHPGLHIFGFTAHAPESDLGRALVRVREAYHERFWIRHSGRTGPWGSFTIDFPTQKKTLGDAIVCPAQLDANEGSPRQVHCGNCAVCWSTDHAVAFIEH